MTNVSKSDLPEKELSRLFCQFGKSLANLDKSNADNFLSELLGPEEEIMLAKRLCAIAMFIEDNSSYQVWQALHLSPTTANKIRLNYECGRYKNIEVALKANRRDYEKLWNTLELVLRAGLPPRGKGRWESILKN